MLGLQRLRVAARVLSRHNVTLAAASTEAPPPPPPSPSPPPAVADAPASSGDAPGTSKATAADSKLDTSSENPGAQRKTKGRVYPTRRPLISLERPREWNRPVASGVLPAYDEALRVLRTDSIVLKKELEDVKAQLSKALQEGGDVAALKEKVVILEVQSEINLPDVRWKFRNGLSDMTKPVYRHLAEKKWRTEGDLDLLMERIHQMGVVPDLLPSLHPSFDLRPTFPEAPPASLYLRTRVKRKHERVEPGVYLLPEQTRKAPSLYVSVYHPETRYYTMAMVDADYPHEDEQGFRSYLHWLQPNIALSAQTTSIPLTAAHTPYIPPHPQRGTPYHRYVILFLPHADPSAKISVPQIADEQRAGFDLRAFAEEHGLDGSKGGAAHMWREVWSEEVSRIYADVLEREEPRFGRPPKYDPYAEMKDRKKYMLP